MTHLLLRRRQASQGLRERVLWESSEAGVLISADKLELLSILVKSVLVLELLAAMAMGADRTTVVFGVDMAICDCHTFMLNPENCSWSSPQGSAVRGSPRKKILLGSGRDQVIPGCSSVSEEEIRQLVGSKWRTQSRKSKEEWGRQGGRATFEWPRLLIEFLEMPIGVREHGDGCLQGSWRRIDILRGCKAYRNMATSEEGGLGDSRLIKLMEVDRRR